MSLGQSEGQGGELVVETSLITMVYLFLGVRSLQSVEMLRHPENAVLNIYVTLGDVRSNNAPGFGST